MEDDKSPFEAEVKTDKLTKKIQERNQSDQTNKVELRKEKQYEEELSHIQNKRNEKFENRRTFIRSSEKLISLQEIASIDASFYSTLKSQIYTVNT